MSSAAQFIHRLHDEEINLLDALRRKRRERSPTTHRKIIPSASGSPTGSPREWGRGTSSSPNRSFLLIWIFLNVTAYVQQWDPYPFILLNLALSFQAAYAAPFIMMSQNRQAAIDRVAAQNDYQINAKAELEIELLHQKIDLLRETEVSELIKVIRRLEARLPPDDREFIKEIENGEPS